jgi:hypothetical protein
MILEHKTSGVKFLFRGNAKLQFTNIYFVSLLNTKTNKLETFEQSTYLNFFTILK